VSLNLGSQGVNACANLGSQGDFVALRLALLEQVRTQMNQALDIEAARRDDAIGYARALRDLWLALEAAATGQKINAVPKPAPAGVGNVR
jgi:hypothetical protein